jgi:hypothetical protein
MGIPPGQEAIVAISNEKKREIIQRLLITKQKAYMTEMLLRFRGMSDEADNVAERAARLSNVIDSMLGKVMEAWTGQVKQIVDSIRGKNTSIQTSIREIQKGVNIAQNTVKVIGYVDDVIEIAAKIASVA